MTSPPGLLCFIKYPVDLELLWQMRVEILKPRLVLLPVSELHSSAACVLSEGFLPACRCLYLRSEDQHVLLLLLCLCLFASSSSESPNLPRPCRCFVAFFSSYYYLAACESAPLRLNEWKMEEKRQPHMFSLLLSLLPGELGVLSWGSMQPRRCLAATLAKAANYIFHLDKNGGFLPMLLIIMKGI